jgi:flagellin-like protein
MITELKSRIEESNRAVSPVIGVILMVAITVILAAVIGTFVLGLGGALQESAPSATVTIQDHPDGIDADTADQNLFNINHQSGDEIAGEDLRITVRNESTNTLVAEWQGGNWDNPEGANTGDTFNGDASGLSTGDFIGTGDRITITGDERSGTPAEYYVDSRYTISLIDTNTDQTIASATVRLR